MFVLTLFNFNWLRSRVVEMMVEVMVDVKITWVGQFVFNLDSRTCGVLSACEGSVLSIRQCVEKRATLAPSSLNQVKCIPRSNGCHRRSLFLMMETLSKSGGVLLSEIEVTFVFLREGLVDELLKMEQVF